MSDSPIRGIRLAAAVVLAAQLNQVALPLACAPSARAVPCHEAPAQAPGAAQFVTPGSAHHVPCPDGAMCGAPVAGIPEAVITLTVLTARPTPVPAVPTLHPGESSPPLSPPPQA